MSLKIGIIMDPIEHMHYHKDSTLAMCWEAQKRQHRLYYIQIEHLFQQNNQILAHTFPLTTYQNPNQWFQLGSKETQSLDTFDIILMRKDPPFNMNYIYATYLLDQVNNQGVKVINRPASLRSHNEKLSVLRFPSCHAPTLVTSQMEQIADFHQEHGTIILKPLDGMGGQGIFKINPSGENLGSCVEQLTQQYQTPIIAQAFIPEIAEGDKRILMIAGEPIPYALARIPKKGEIRGNLAAGGYGEGRALTEDDLRICRTVAPFLQAEGIVFAGLDIIGSFLTEINITSPTCIRELDQAYQLNIAGKLFDAIAA